MDWTTFKANTLEFVWRTGDTTLDTQMSDLVSTAENRLRVDLDWHDTEVTASLTVDAYPSVALPAGVDQIMALIWDDKGPGTFVTAREYYSVQPDQEWIAGAAMPAYTFDQREFTKIGDNLFHHYTTAATDNVDATLVYIPTFSSLEGGDDSLYNAYEALYKAATYAEVYNFLMNKQEAAYWEKKYDQLLYGAQTEQNNRKYAGSPLKMQMPRTDVS